MIKISKIYILLVLMTFSSCEHYSNILYTIKSDTSEIIDLTVTYNWNSSYTESIDISEEHTFFMSDDIGATTEKRMAGLDSIDVVFELEITSASGKTNKNDLKVISYWELIYPEGLGGDGRVFRSITDEDLE